MAHERSTDTDPVNGQAALDRLRDDVDRTRTRWHRARCDLDDAWRRAQEAVRDELIAADEHRRAVTAYEAGRRP